MDVKLLSLGGAVGSAPRWQDQPAASVSVTGPAPGSSVDELAAFVFANYTRSLGGAHRSEQLRATTGPQLRFRFRPSQPGLHTWSANITWRGRQWLSAGSFTVSADPPAVPAAQFVSIAQNGRYFCRGQDSAAFYPVGGNMECWDCVLGEQQRGGELPSRAPANGTYEYDRWFRQLAAAGGNYARVWINVPTGLWTELAPNITVQAEGGQTTLPGGGLGHFDMASGWRIDHLLSSAERYGIVVLISIEMSRTQSSSGEFWTWSPYSRRGGGMLSNATDFFSNEIAMVAFEARLRYLVARFSHSPSLFGWELFNEVNCDKDIPNDKTLAAWHSRMAYLLHTTPSSSGHVPMVSTSFCGDPLIPAKEQLAATMKAVYYGPGMDFSQTRE